MEIFVRGHGTAFVPLTSSDDMHPPHTEAIARTHDRTHVEIPQRVFAGNLQLDTILVQLGDDIFMAAAFEVIEEVARVVRQQGSFSHHESYTSTLP